MTKKIFILLLVLSLGIFSKSVHASHVSGGEVTYSYVGPNQYQVNLILYWDCGSFDPGTSQTMTATNTCGLASVNFTVNLDTAYEISQICPSSLNQTTCGTGSLPGNKKNVYSAIVTLPGACTLWTFEHTSCCRNVSTNVPTQPSYTFYATLNNVAAPTNNSPYYTSQPLPYFCVNQPVCFSPGVVELDGHTLSFSFVSAMDGNSTTPVPYAGGYSGTSPMPGIAIDPITGLISFTPTMQGNFVVSFLVTETNASGVVVGSVIRDIQMIVVNCSNQVISCNAGTLTNLTGTGATQTGPNSMQICENIPFTFQATFQDPDAGDILTISSNIAQVLPGAVITMTGTNPVTITVSWTAPPGSANTNTTFAVTVADDACPVPGQQTTNYIIDVLSAASAGPDQLKCGNQGVTLNSVGPGTVFNWSVLSGDPIVVGTNFSCNPCQNPVASPSVTTTYVLTCSGGNGCIINDTVTVNVVPDFTYNVTQSGTSSCLLQPIQLGIANLTPNTTGYTYNWSPATYLSSTTISNPVATITAPGTYNYTVSVTSPQGCVKTDNVAITVVPAVSPTITAHADTSFCGGGTANLGVSFGNAVPAVCGLTTSGPCAVPLPYTIGTGNLTTNAYPTPFASFWHDGRIQILYLASELIAGGMTGGKISSAAFNIVTKGSIAPYNGFTIKMKCTPLSSLPTTFQTGLTTVYGPISSTTTVGWNTYNFPTAYEWDGISNIIVEVCFDNTAYDPQNDVVQKTTTAFNSTIMQYTDGAVGCSLNAPTTYT
ncbi:MAG: hypothetical protein L6Q66_05040, partial [Bacteroidia bacterium]|nr:hypothetical protein [Bacteroidia bacterium]